jgi:hypothetical protein
LHSIGLLLFRHNRHEAFHQFLDDMLLRARPTYTGLGSFVIGR